MCVLYVAANNINEAIFYVTHIEREKELTNVTIFIQYNKQIDTQQIHRVEKHTLINA